MASNAEVRVSDEVHDEMRSHGAVAAPQSLGRAVANTIKGALGNLVEWYDVY